MPAPSEMAGAAWADLIREQLEVERAAKTSLEQRGLSIVSASGVIVALAAVVAGARFAQLPILTRGLLLAALVAFSVAALFGIRTAWPRWYREVRAGDLEARLAREPWESSGSLGLMRASEVRLTVLRRFRDENTKKADTLKWAMRAEVTAILFVAGSVAATVLLD